MPDDERVVVDRLAHRKRGRPGEEIELLLSDSSSFFVALRVWEENPIHEGDLLGPQEVSEIRRKSEYVAARHHAMSLLARSEHSAFLLSQKLTTRGHSREAVSAALEDLSETGLLSDSRYAQSWVRSRVRRHPEGRTMLLAGLRQRGVDSETAEAAVDEVLQSDDGALADGARRLAERHLRSGKYSVEIIEAKLRRRGFTREVVRHALEQLRPGNDADSGKPPVEDD